MVASGCRSGFRARGGAPWSGASPVRPCPTPPVRSVCNGRKLASYAGAGLAGLPHAGREKVWALPLGRSFLQRLCVFSYSFAKNCFEGGGPRGWVHARRATPHIPAHRRNHPRTRRPRRPDRAAVPAVRTSPSEWRGPCCSPTYGLRGPALWGRLTAALAGLRRRHDPQREHLFFSAVRKIPSYQHSPLRSLFPRAWCVVAAAPARRRAGERTRDGPETRNKRACPHTHVRLRAGLQLPANCKELAKPFQ
jgi:hypothetical protein